MTLPPALRLAALTLAILLLTVYATGAEEAPPDPKAGPIALIPQPPLRMNLDDRIGDIQIVEDSGQLGVVYEGHRYTPAQYLGMIAAKQGERDDGGILFITFNITSWMGITWVAVGLLGQLLFTARMVVQWIASEKEKRSVVPPVFWHLSLIGATMLLAYFIWRKDVVGILGQATGFFIYLRNVYLIYATARRRVAPPAPAPEAVT